MIIPNVWTNKTCSSHHQPVMDVHPRYHGSVCHSFWPSDPAGTTRVPERPITAMRQVAILGPLDCWQRSSKGVPEKYGLVFFKPNIGVLHGFTMFYQAVLVGFWWKKTFWLGRKWSWQFTGTSFCWNVPKQIHWNCTLIVMGKIDGWNPH